MTERKRQPNTNSSNLRQVTTGTVVRIETPNSSRQHKTSTARIVVQEINPVEGFVGFLRDHAIVGLSIGFIIGTQMSTLVKIILASFIDPATHLLFGTALSQRTFTLHFHSRAAQFGWGAVVYGLIQLIFLLIFIYAAVKIFNLDKLDKPQEPKK